MTKPWSAEEDAMVLAESAKPASKRRYLDLVPDRTHGSIKTRAWNLRHRRRPSELPGAGNGTQPKTPAPSWSAEEDAIVLAESRKPMGQRRFEGLVPNRTAVAAKQRVVILRRRERPL